MDDNTNNNSSGDQKDGSIPGGSYTQSSSPPFTNKKQGDDKTSAAESNKPQESPQKPMPGSQPNQGPQQSGEKSDPTTVVTGSDSPGSGKKSTKVIATIFGVALLMIGVAAGVFLVQREQEIRERAASGQECQQSEDCILLDDPGNSGSFEAPRIISYIEITAKEFHRYDTSTNDGCYNVRIEDRSVSWSKVGSGPDCKDVSNVQVHLGEEKIDKVTCPINPTEGRSVIILNESSENQLLSNRGENRAVFGPVSVSIAPGTYRVTLVSYDSHSSHSPSQTDQTRESWFLNTNAGDTPAISDLPLAQDWLIEVVTENFEVGEQITSVTARHAAYPDTSSPNSVSPVCAAFESIEVIPTPTPISSPTPTPTPPPNISAQCNDVKVYDMEWNLLTTQDLSDLSAGDTIRFAVSGTASQGTFDKAKFTVNSLSLGETSNLKPGSNEFYVEYEIPEEVASFTVNAQVHHSELGWF